MLNFRFSCLVVGNSFYFAVLLPVALILLINFVVLMMVGKSLTRKSSANLSSTQKQTGKRQVRIALMCSTLLGLTWILGLFAVADLTYTFQLLFTIFNSLQGFFIFVFYTLMNKEIQKEGKKIFRFGSTDDGKSTTFSSLPIDSTLKKTNLISHEGKI